MDLGVALDDLRRLVEAESPSGEPDALSACARVLVEVLDERLGGSARVGEDDRVLWEGGGGGGWSGPASPILILGHLDTVWPLGTLAERPFEVVDGRVTGPGVFDMKGGLVAVVHALSRLRARGGLPPVRMLVTTDEEVGSPRSRDQVATEARRCGRVLVPEPCGSDGAIKTARKGVAMGELIVHGRASHSGLAPEEGINAAVVLGGLLERVTRLDDPERGTTVTPTVMEGGTAVNAVPARAAVRIDVRFFHEDELVRVEEALRALPVPAGARLEVHVRRNRPAMRPEASEPLLPALRAAAAETGLEVGTVTVGGASDGNLGAAAGAAVLDGLGPEGGGAHAEHEHITVPGLDARIRLLSALVPHVAAVGGPRSNGSGR